jgi:hypothetical protein
MEFEYDERKSQANLAKHGIDFVSAQALWEDRDVSRSRRGPRTSRGG